MKSVKHNLSTLVAALLGVAMVSNVALAQTDERLAQGLAEGQKSTIPCTVRVVYDSGVKNKSNTPVISPAANNLKTSDFPATYLPTHSAVFSQTAQDTHFGYTFTKLPTMLKDPCCGIKGAVLDVTYHALSGGPAGSATASNDGGTMMKNGASLPSGSVYLWNNQAVTAGQNGSRSYSVPSSYFSNGQLSYFAQDDTAIDSLRLRIFACCPDKKGRAGEMNESSPSAL